MLWIVQKGSRIKQSEHNEHLDTRRMDGRTRSFSIFPLPPIALVPFLRIERVFLNLLSFIAASVAALSAAMSRSRRTHVSTIHRRNINHRPSTPLQLSVAP